VSWNPPDAGFHFRVKVFVVDDTYWDDGNRTTSRSSDFRTLKEALDYQTGVLKARQFKLTSGVTGVLFSRSVDADDVHVYKWFDSKWHQLNSTDVVTMLGQISE
jgi:hypothetical protein